MAFEPKTLPTKRISVDAYLFSCYSLLATDTQLVDDRAVAIDIDLS
jgi:hypothetical protein